MSILSVFSVSVIGILLCGIMKSVKAEYCIWISIATSVIVILFILGTFEASFNTIKTLVDSLNLKSETVTSVVKAIGTGYLAEIVCGLCESVGDKSLGEKIEFAEKAYILSLSVPFLSDLVKSFSELCSL